MQWYFPPVFSLFYVRRIAWSSSSRKNYVRQVQLILITLILQHKLSRLFAHTKMWPTWTLDNSKRVCTQTSKIVGFPLSSQALINQCWYGISGIAHTTNVAMYFKWYNCLNNCIRLFSIETTVFDRHQVITAQTRPSKSSTHFKTLNPDIEMEAGWLPTILTQFKQTKIYHGTRFEIRTGQIRSNDTTCALLIPCLTPDRKSRNSPEWRLKTPTFREMLL